MKGGAHPSPFASLSSLIRKRYPFTAGLTEFSSRRIAKLSLKLTLHGDFLHHNGATLTTRPWRLSNKNDDNNNNRQPINAIPVVSPHKTISI